MESRKTMRRIFRGSLKLSALLALIACPALRAAEAPVLDRFQYSNEAALRAVWKAGSLESPPAGIVAGPEGRAIARFSCPFGTLKDWRVYWDRDIKLDLSKTDRILVKLKAADPVTAPSCKIYLRSGKGWYNLKEAGVSATWKTAVIFTKGAVEEGKPSGWGKIDGIRFSFLPGVRKDTFVDVSTIEAGAGWNAGDIGKVGPYPNFKAASKALKGKQMREAAKLYAGALHAKDPSSLEAQANIEKGRRLVAEAYALAQKPEPGEFRAFWCHHGDGPRGLHGERAKTWNEAIPLIAKAGFNAIFPNMLWSGVAFYPSKVVPPSEVVAKDGDQLAQIIKVAHANGVQVHLWKVSWQFAEGWLAPKGVSDPFRKAGRLQMNLKGETVPWLCPSDPRNREYELAAFLEAADYDVDGLHLDYIRYGGQDVCYCPGCRERFGKVSGKPVKDWPKDVAEGGERAEEYAQWKRDNITSFVRELRHALKKKKPELKLSAAVFSRPDQARNSVSQDWPVWVKEGLLDFVCTMTYTEDLEDFRSMVRGQLAAIGGKAPLYAGIYATYGPEQNQALDTLVDEVKSGRELGTKGFVLFELEDHLFQTLLPFLAKGLTKP